MKNNSSQTYGKDALLWVEELISNTGTRLTGSVGCKKAAEMIFQKFEQYCTSIFIQKFTHSRDAFLSVVKIMPISYVIALISIWFGGYWNYVAAICMIFVSIAVIFEFMYYKEFLDLFYPKVESQNIIGNINGDNIIYLFKLKQI